jgi:hypothetical protein
MAEAGAVRRWLADLGLDRFADAFAEQQIDEEVLAELSDADLKELGIPLGPRKKLLKAIAALGEIASAPSSEPRQQRECAHHRPRPPRRRNAVSLPSCSAI